MLGSRAWSAERSALNAWVDISALLPYPPTKRTAVRALLGGVSARAKPAGAAIETTAVKSQSSHRAFIRAAHYAPAVALWAINLALAYAVATCGRRRVI